MTSRDDVFRDKFRTGDAPLTGSVLYSVRLPDNLEFIAEVNDALLAMTLASNWEKVGSQSVDDSASTASDVFRSFGPMIGTVFAVAWATIPDNYLLCDGQEYFKVDYPVLYDLLSFEYRVGSDKFKTPNLGGRVPIGVNDDFPPQQMGGEFEHTLSVDEMPSHDHTTQPHTHNAYQATYSVAGFPEVPVSSAVYIYSPVASATVDVNNTGGGQPHENMPPYCAIKFVICAR